MKPLTGSGCARWSRKMAESCCRTAATAHIRTTVAVPLRHFTCSHARLPGAAWQVTPKKIHLSVSAYGAEHSNCAERQLRASSAAPWLYGARQLSYCCCRPRRSNDGRCLPKPSFCLPMVASIVLFLHQL